MPSGVSDYLNPHDQQFPVSDRDRANIADPLLVVDEVGYIPFDPEAANLMFALVSSRYERASMIVTSNKPFSAWGEIFGDDAVATAMIDRLIHHADILSLKGDSYRLRGKDIGPRPSRSTDPA